MLGLSIRYIQVTQEVTTKLLENKHKQALAELKAKQEQYAMRQLQAAGVACVVRLSESTARESRCCRTPRAATDVQCFCEQGFSLVPAHALGAGTRETDYIVGNVTAGSDSAKRLSVRVEFVLSIGSSAVAAVRVFMTATHSESEQVRAREQARDVAR